MEESKYARTLALQKDQNQVRSITIITLVPNRIKLEKLGTKQREQKLIGRGTKQREHQVMSKCLGNCACGASPIISVEELFNFDLCLFLEMKFLLAVRSQMFLSSIFQ